MTPPKQNRAEQRWGPFGVVLGCLVSLMVVCCGTGFSISDSQNRFLARAGIVLTVIGAACFWLSLLTAIAAFLYFFWNGLFGGNRK